MVYRLKNMLAYNSRDIHCSTGKATKWSRKKWLRGLQNTKQKIRHEHYEQCLFHQEQQMTTRNKLRSLRRNIVFLKLSKIGWSPFDNKRYILCNGCVTLAYGHYASRQDNLDQYNQELTEV